MTKKLCMRSGTWPASQRDELSLLELVREKRMCIGGINFLTIASFKLQSPIGGQDSSIGRKLGSQIHLTGGTDL